MLIPSKTPSEQTASNISDQISKIGSHLRIIASILNQTAQEVVNSQDTEGFLNLCGLATVEKQKDLHAGLGQAINVAINAIDGSGDLVDVSPLVDKLARANKILDYVDGSFKITIIEPEPIIVEEPVVVPEEEIV